MKFDESVEFSFLSVFVYFVGVRMMRFCSCRESGIGLCEGDTTDRILFGINVMFNSGYESLTHLSFASILLFLVSARLRSTTMLKITHRRNSRRKPHPNHHHLFHPSSSSQHRDRLVQ